MHLAITLGIIEALCMAFAAGATSLALVAQGKVKVMALVGEAFWPSAPGGSGKIKTYCKH